MSKNVSEEINQDQEPVEDQSIQFEVVDEAEMSELDEAKAKLAESEKRALVAAADLENYRKRANKNAQEQVKYAALRMMGELLESVDNLNRAIESAESESANSTLLEGVKMVSSQILNILKSNHCKQIEAVGQPFDPNLHEAIQMQASEEFDSNTVMMEIRTGYMLHDRVIRPAQVFVSTGPSAKN